MLISVLTPLILCSCLNAGIKSSFMLRVISLLLMWASSVKEILNLFNRNHVILKLKFTLKLLCFYWKKRTNLKINSINCKPMCLNFQKGIDWCKKIWSVENWTGTPDYVVTWKRAKPSLRTQFKKTMNWKALDSKYISNMFIYDKLS